MNLELPLWMVEELSKERQRSLQSHIKLILSEYLKHPDWRVVCINLAKEIEDSREDNISYRGGIYRDK